MKLFIHWDHTQANVKMMQAKAQRQTGEKQIFAAFSILSKVCQTESLHSSALRLRRTQEELSTNLELVSSLHVELRQADWVLRSVAKALFERSPCRPRCC